MLFLTLLHVTKSNYFNQSGNCGKLLTTFVDIHFFAIFFHIIGDKQQRYTRLREKKLRNFNTQIEQINVGRD